MYKVKRVYDPPAGDDGYRVLVDRLWPRGLTKDRAALDEWYKAIAPSPELRTWFGHQAERYEEFSLKYREELSQNHEDMEHLRQLEYEHGTVCLLYAARDPAVNHAVVLRDYLALG